MTYRPRRASARWMEGAPEYVLSCHDNGGRSVDRYTVFFGGSMWEPEMGRSVHYLAMSATPSHPQGVGLSGEAPATFRDRAGPKCRWLDLPPEVRRCVRDFADDTQVDLFG